MNACFGVCWCLVKLVSIDVELKRLVAHLGIKDLVVVGNLVMKVPLLFTWPLPLGTHHTFSTLDPLHMYMNQHSLLSTFTLCELYMTNVVLRHLQKSQ